MSMQTRRHGRRVLLVGCVLTVSILTPPGPAAGAPEPDDSLLRAFSSTSWWNTALPAGSPQHANETGILNYLRTAEDNGGGFLRFAGAGDSEWGQPVYWARPGDKEYDVRWSAGLRQPELDNLRIPANMRAADTSDGALTLFDVERGYVVAMTDAVYRGSSATWEVGGATVTYLDSNGLDSRLSRSDDPRNSGSHRGNNGATMMARFDEVLLGQIDHVIKVACGPECSTEHVFPMVNSDGDSASSPVKQGLRMRIRPEVNLAVLGLHPEALVIALAAQEYGVYFGDSGGTTALKLENTRAEGRGQLWDVSADALADLPFTSQFWDVISEGYDPSAPSDPSEP